MKISYDTFETVVLSGPNRYVWEWGTPGSVTLECPVTWYLSGSRPKFRIKMVDGRQSNTFSINRTETGSYSSRHFVSCRCWWSFNSPIFLFQVCHRSCQHLVFGYKLFAVSDNILVNTPFTDLILYGRDVHPFFIRRHILIGQVYLLYSNQ